MRRLGTKGLATSIRDEKRINHVSAEGVDFATDDDNVGIGEGARDSVEQQWFVVRSNFERCVTGWRVIEQNSRGSP